MDVRKKKFTEHQLDRGLRHNERDINWGRDEERDVNREYHRANEDCHDAHVNIVNNKKYAQFQLFKDALAFGRPGCGAPARTKSGRIRTTIKGNPEIR